MAARGRLMQALPAGGGMAAVFATEAWGSDAVAAYPETLSVAAVNAPSEIVISDGSTIFAPSSNKLGRPVFTPAS